MKLPVFLDDLGMLLYPDYCRGCGINLPKGESLICVGCQIRLPRSGFYNYEQNPVARLFWGRLPLESAFSYLHFSKKGLVQNLMHELKYKQCPELGVKLGKLFASELEMVNVGRPVDCVVPVPLHPRKELLRGYNQSRVIAEGISDVWGVELIQPLERRVETETQTRKSKFERWQNVGESFGLKSSDSLEGRHVLLLDDVITTGATIEACAQEILKIRDVRLSVASLAFPLN